MSTIEATATAAATTTTTTNNPNYDDSFCFSKPQVEAYLVRIGVPSSPLPELTLATVERLAIQHLLHVPFENLTLRYNSVQYSPPNLSKEALFDKIVVRRRGGYCHEINSAFIRLLASLGFSVRRGRGSTVVPGDLENPRFASRAHTLTFLDFAGPDGIVDTYLVDVGYGTRVAVGVLKLQEGLGPKYFQGTSRQLWLELCDFEDVGREWYVRYRATKDSAWIPCFRFLHETVTEEDVQAMNVYCASHPDSIINKYIYASLLVNCDEGYHVIRLLNQKVYLKNGNDKLFLRNEQDRVMALEMYFGIRLNDSEKAGIEHSGLALCDKGFNEASHQTAFCEAFLSVDCC